MAADLYERVKAELARRKQIALLATPSPWQYKFWGPPEDIAHVELHQPRNMLEWYASEERLLLFHHPVSFQGGWVRSCACGEDWLCEHVQFCAERLGVAFGRTRRTNDQSSGADRLAPGRVAGGAGDQDPDARSAVA